MIKIFEYQQTNIMPLVYLRIKAGCCWLKKKKNIFLSSNKNNSRKIKHRSGNGKGVRDVLAVEWQYNIAMN